MLSGPQTTAAALQLTGSGIGTINEIGAARSAGFTTPDGLQHLGYAAGNAMNLAANALSVSGIQGSSVPALHVAGDSTHLMSALGHLGYLEGLNPPPANLADLERDDVVSADSDMIALGGDITSFFNGTVPKLVADSLGTLHDSVNFFYDGFTKGWGSDEVASDVYSVAGDVVGLIGDALGGDGAKQPLDVTFELNGQASGANFVLPVAVFSDPNVLNGMPPPASDYSAMIDWGDGSFSVGQVVLDNPSNPTATYDVIGAHTYAVPGSYPVAVTVAGDGAQGEAQEPFTAGPNIQPESAQSDASPTIVAGQAFDGPLFIVDTSAHGSQSQAQYVSTIDWGDGTASPGELVYEHGTNRFDVDGSHVYSQPGTYTVQLQISAPDGSSASATTTISVVATSQALPNLIATGKSLSISGLTIDGTVATFSDPDGDVNPGDYSATISWDDGAQSGGGQSVGQIVSNGDGSFSVIGSYSYSHFGEYLPNVVIDDNTDGSFSSVGSSVNAAAPLTPNPIRATAGVSFTGSVATFSWGDPSAQPSDFGVVIHWGDETGPEVSNTDTESNGQLVRNADGTYSVVGTHTYPGNGTYSVLVQVFPPDFGSYREPVDASTTADVGAGGTIVTGQSLSTGANQHVSGTVATLTAPAGSVASDYSASINWGDGTITAGQLVDEGNGTFAIQGTHTYSQNGGYLTSEQVSDSKGDLATTFASVAVQPPTLVEDVYIISSGTTTVSAGNGVLANDSGTSQLTVTSGTVSGAEGGTFVFNADGSFTYTPPENFRGFDYAKYTAVDAVGAQSTAIVNVVSQQGGVIWKFYEQVLHRDPDYPGLQGWIEDLLSGGKPGDIAAGFFESTELLNQVITGYYNQYLGRGPQGNDLAGWESVFRQAGGPEIIKAGFAASPEFNALAGNSSGTNPAGWLTALYAKILNRAPLPGDLPFWEKQLAGGTSEYQVALDFFQSLEAYNNDVTAWFYEYLGRAPTTGTGGEQPFFAQQMLAGASDKAIEQAITNSPEYSANPPPSPPGTAERLPDYLPTTNTAKTQASIAATDAIFGAAA